MIRHGSVKVRVTITSMPDYNISGPLFASSDRSARCLSTLNLNSGAMLTVLGVYQSQLGPSVLNRPGCLFETSLQIFSRWDCFLLTSTQIRLTIDLKIYADLPS